MYERAIRRDILQTPVQQRIGTGDDAGERRTHLMRDICDEVFADLFQALQVRDVVEDGDSAAAGWGSHRRGVDFERAPSCRPDRERSLDVAARRYDVFDDLLDARVAHELQQGQSIGNGRAHSNRLGERFIREDYTQVLVDREDALGHAGENCLPPRNLDSQGIYDATDLDRHGRNRSLEGSDFVARVEEQPVTGRGAQQTVR